MSRPFLFEDECVRKKFLMMLIIGTVEYIITDDDREFINKKFSC